MLSDGSGWQCVWQCVCCVCCVLFSVLFLECVLYVVCCVVMCLCLWLFLFILAEFVVYLVLLLYYFVFSEYKEKQRNTTNIYHILYVWCFFYVLWLFSFLIVLLLCNCLFYVGECEDIASNTEDTTHKANNNPWFCKGLSKLCCIWKVAKLHNLLINAIKSGKTTQTRGCKTKVFFYVPTFWWFKNNMFGDTENMYPLFGVPHKSRDTDHFFEGATKSRDTDHFFEGAQESRDTKETCTHFLGVVSPLLFPWVLVNI